uniref:Uncharacterized protein n=1 Tax=Tanacetum cinerariifolium TaxID=118510 RepID=A0A6L2JZD1_TANCI|nr:hypothetical protein [Tanacetum cinerariifolium]
MKNKVEAQPRNVNIKNRVVKPIHNVDVKHSLLKANSEPICATCKKSMFNGVHDMCLLDFVKNTNSRAKLAKKHKKQNIWKPTGHVFTEVGFKWKPTGRTFTTVGNSCPLTRITSANVVPPKKTTSHSAEPQKPELKVYSRKPKNVKNVGSSKKAKIVKSKNANHSEPNHIGDPMVQLDSGTTILNGSWGMVNISWEMLLSQEYTMSRGLVSSNRSKGISQVGFEANAHRVLGRRCRRRYGAGGCTRVALGRSLNGNYFRREKLLLDGWAWDGFRVMEIPVPEVW